jgi:endonuclease/exonuclease/phosphatase family metal-dependent hydrolase
MGTSEVVVASFNLHAGVDGWGRPYDVVDACRLLQADVLVLQESWRSSDGDDLAGSVGSELGYSVVSRTLATGRRAGPHPGARSTW